MIRARFGDSKAIFVFGICKMLEELKEQQEYIRIDTVLEMLDDEPRVQVVKRSAWKNDGYNEEHKFSYYTCVKCGCRFGGYKSKYCPKCGCKMYDASCDEPNATEEET